MRGGAAPARDKYLKTIRKSNRFSDRRSAEGFSLESRVADDRERSSDQVNAGSDPGESFTLVRARSASLGRGPVAMVVIHCKGKSEEHQFLYETTVAVPVSQLVKELVDIHNTRLRIQRLKVRHPARSSRAFGACVPRTRRPVGRPLPRRHSLASSPPPFAPLLRSSLPLRRWRATTSRRTAPRARRTSKASTRTSRLRRTGSSSPPAGRRTARTPPASATATPPCLRCRRCFARPLTTRRRRRAGSRWTPSDR